MNKRDLKLDAIDKLSQLIIFQKDGAILESDAMLTGALSAEANIWKDTLLSGMAEEIENLRSGEQINLDCVDTDLFGKKAQYDFVIKRLDDDSFSFIAYDYSKQYNKLFELQQERNLAEMKIIRLEKKNSQLMSEKAQLDKLYTEHLSGGAKHILVKSDNLHVNIDLSKVLYLEAYGDYIKVHTFDKSYVTHSTMKNVESKLPESNFFRIHRSFIVALDKINNIEQMSLLIGEKILPIGKSYKSTLLEKIKHI